MESREVNTWYTTRQPTSQHSSLHGESSGSRELATRVCTCRIREEYMCHNAGHRCYGRVIMTPVDTKCVLFYRKHNTVRTGTIESCARTLEVVVA